MFSILPAVIRFVQCIRRFQDSGDSFPHLVNAGKYSTTLLKAAAQRNFRLKESGSLFYESLRNFKIFKLKKSHLKIFFCLPTSQQDHFNFLVWVAAETFSSVYCLWWDLTQDWGLLEKSKNGSRRLLRNRIIYKRPFYHFGKKKRREKEAKTLFSDRARHDFTVLLGIQIGCAKDDRPSQRRNQHDFVRC